MFTYTYFSPFRSFQTIQTPTARPSRIPPKILNNSHHSQPHQHPNTDRKTFADDPEAQKEFERLQTKDAWEARFRENTETRKKMASAALDEALDFYGVDVRKEAAVRVGMMEREWGFYWVFRFGWPIRVFIGVFIGFLLKIQIF